MLLVSPLIDLFQNYFAHFLPNFQRKIFWFWAILTKKIVNNSISWLDSANILLCFSNFYEVEIVKCITNYFQNCNENLFRYGKKTRKNVQIVKPADTISIVSVIKDQNHISFLKIG